MRMLMAGAVLALALLGAATAEAQVAQSVYGADNSRIVRPPERAKPPEPVAREDFDKAVGKLFRAGDSDGDGTITLAEFNAGIDARKNRMIAERFAGIDTDRDQSISMAEFAVWQRAMGSAALSDSASAGTSIDAYVGEKLAVDYGDSHEELVLAQVIVPLNAVDLVSANTDYDTGTSLAELVAFEGKRFDQLDVNKDGWLTADETRSLMRPDEGLAAGPAPGAPPR